MYYCFSLHPTLTFSLLVYQALNCWTILIDHLLPCRTCEPMFYMVGSRPPSKRSLTPRISREPHSKSCSRMHSENIVTSLLVQLAGHKSENGQRWWSRQLDWPKQGYMTSFWHVVVISILTQYPKFTDCLFQARLCVSIEIQEIWLCVSGRIESVPTFRFACFQSLSKSCCNVIPI